MASFAAFNASPFNFSSSFGVPTFSSEASLSVVDDFAVFLLRVKGFVFLLFVLHFVFSFAEDETHLASFEAEDVPVPGDDECARIREEIGFRLIFFFPLFASSLLLTNSVLSSKEYEEQHVIVVIETVMVLFLSLCLSFKVIITRVCVCK